MKRIGRILPLLLVVGCSPSSSGAGPAAPASRMEGQWDYVGSLRGQASVTDGRFVFLFGGPADTAAMTSNAGTYVITRDTASARIAYSTSKSNVGMTFRWTISGWSGDTASFVVMNDSGRVTARGRAIKRRA